ncbi:MAG TPA: L-histidine N(alpha)-methyltransferase [Rhizomicrobium sp.]|nr:L-histidine N(alpha)-methyltransferase [Rhizomicrobium sp.]
MMDKPTTCTNLRMDVPDTGTDDSFARDFLAGLSATPKTIACKYFYDAEGSRLFDRICELPEYYQTRTETALLQQYAPEMARVMGEHVELIELGAGALTKVRMLLDALKEPRAYLPIDISGDYLREVVRELAADYPNVRMNPVVADFTKPISLPPRSFGSRRVGFFPGSTIGNFTTDEAVRLLQSVAAMLKGGGLLIGFDIVKDPALFHAAYNDSAGVTAAFNKNLLARANRELGVDFDLDAFAHYAPYNPNRARVEMYLVSLINQRVNVGGETIAFAKGEPVHTENSHKFTRESFTALARKARFAARQFWTDPEEIFALAWLEPG